MDDFVDVYAISTGRKQRVPRHWLEDPVLGRDFQVTPSQRERDGDLGRRPNSDSTVKEIDKYADKAGIDLTGVSSKDDKLAAIEAVFGPGEEQAGLLEVEAAPPVADPLAPSLVAQGNPSDLPGVSVETPTTDPTDGTEPSEQSPATGNEEN